MAVIGNGLVEWDPGNNEVNIKRHGISFVCQQLYIYLLAWNISANRYICMCMTEQLLSFYFCQQAYYFYIIV